LRRARGRRRRKRKKRRRTFVCGGKVLKRRQLRMTMCKRRIDVVRNES